MGFIRKPRTYELIFTDPEMAGLEVTMKSLPVGRYFELDRLTDSGKAEDAEAALGMVAGSIISWNLEDEDGKPVPADLDGLKAQDLEFVGLLLRAWREGMASVDPTLLNGSSASGITQEVSLELASLSQSLESLPRQN